MPKDRHKGRRMQFYLSDDELGRLDRLGSGCNTDHERILKLMEIAEKSKDVKVEENKEIKSLRSQVNKLLEDLKKQPQSKVEYKEVIKEVPKIEYRDRIVEKPIYKGEKIIEKIVEKPIEKIVEKTVYVGDDDWLPKYWPFDSQEEYEKWLNN